jgi:hypothetical protein
VMSQPASSVAHPRAAALRPSGSKVHARASGILSAGGSRRPSKCTAAALDRASRSSTGKARCTPHVE